jgi:Ca2+-binding RTX toxin-like protein
MMRTRVVATLGAAGVMCASFAGVASVSQAAPVPADKVSICHRTGSATNPYVQITVSKAGADAHLKNHDGTLNWPAAPYKAKVLTVGQDFKADPVTGCKFPPAGPVGPFVLCVVSVGVTQTGTTVTGTSADDTIDCTNASPGKTINGLDGNDTITGTQFGDVINGGNGNDTVTGGPGDDVIEGGNGNDTLTGSAGNDVVTDVGDGNDTITP